MIKNNLKGIALLLTLAVSIPLTFNSCTEKQKEINLSTDVKQQIKDEEKNAPKLVKEKELDLGSMIYSPICWKDDENLIVTEGSEKNKNVIDLNSVNIDDINLYNVNTKTSKVTQINTITNAVCGDVGKKDMYGNFLYIKDEKLYMYNVLQNTQKSIYDLSGIMKELRENPAIPHEENEILKRIHAGFVLGSNKYVYIMVATKSWQKYSLCNATVIDLETQNETKWSFDGGYFPYLDTTKLIYSWAYNKSKDAFYMSSSNYNVIYEFKPENTNLNKIEKAGGMIFDISEDGDYLYLGGAIIQKRAIVKYDTSKNKAAEILSGSTKSNGEVSIFTGVSTSNNVIGYNVDNYVIESDKKTISSIQAVSFIGDFDGKEIKNARMLPVEKLDSKNNMNYIMLNKKGDSFIYTVAYYDYNSKDEVVKFCKVNTYLYQIQR